MHNSSLLEILRTFTPEEIKSFEDFVSSPYFNKKSAVSNLYKHIKKYAPEFSNPRLKKEKVWSSLFKDKEYNYGLFKNFIYELTRLAENFITIEHSDDFQFSYTLLDCLNERKIKKLFKSKFNVLIKNIDDLHESKDFDAENYYDIMAKMYLLKFYFGDQFDRHSKLGDEFNRFTVFRTSYILCSIIHTCNDALIFSKNYIYSKEENILLSFLRLADSNNLISELLESIKPLSPEIYKTLNTYYKYYKSLTDNTSIEKYLDFKKDLFSNAAGYSRNDRYRLYDGLRSSVSKLVFPEINMSREILEIARLKIKHEVMLNPDGSLTISEFISSIQTACNLDDSEFIEEFTGKFLKFLPKDSKENMKKYSMAHLYFTKNEFEKSLNEILTINYDLFGMKLYLKNLQMMNYYELNDYNSFLLAFDSYKHFLRNNKSVLEEWRNIQLMFANFLNSLFKLRENFDEFELNNLKIKIYESSVPKKQWLLRKVEKSMIVQV